MKTACFRTISIVAIALLFGISCSKGGSDTKAVAATAISLNKKEAVLEKGGTMVLSVSFNPSNATDKTLTWTSSNTAVATVVNGTVTAVDVGKADITVKNGSLTDRCAVTVVISAGVVTLDKNSLKLFVGETEKLVATIIPANTTDSVKWSSSDETVATVKDGLVKAIGAGTATITITVGAKSAECSVTVRKPAPAGSVDLGLSVYWAACNLCEGGFVSSPEQFGDYYAWGETAPKETYYWTNYKWSEGAWNTLTKYNVLSSQGTVDNKTVLESEDDAAHVKLGGKWRMPTLAEWEELVANCNWEWTTRNGVAGGLITSKITGDSIFLPAGGKRLESGLFNTYGGLYWTSSLHTGYPQQPNEIYPNNAWYGYVYFNSTDNTKGFGVSIDVRINGFFIRAVTKE